MPNGSLWRGVSLCRIHSFADKMPVSGPFPAPDARELLPNAASPARQRSSRVESLVRPHVTCFGAPGLRQTAILPYSAPIGLSAVTAYTFAINHCGSRGLCKPCICHLLVQRLYRSRPKYCTYSRWQLWAMGRVSSSNQLCGFSPVQHRLRFEQHCHYSRHYILLRQTRSGNEQATARAILENHRLLNNQGQSLPETTVFSNLRHCNDVVKGDCIRNVLAALRGLSYLWRS